MCHDTSKGSLPKIRSARRLISDNGTQFVTTIHALWIEKLPAIRFALNTSKCESTDRTAAYLTFARELRTLDQVNTDLRSVIHNDNFVPEFTPYLKRFEGYMSQIKENIEMSQDRQKTYADKSRRPSPDYKVNDLVWVKLHPLSKAIASCDKPDEPLGVYHTSALTPFLNGTETQSSVVPLKKRGRPRKQPLIPRGTAGENAIMSASTPPRRDGLRRCRGRILYCLIFQFTRAKNSVTSLLQTPTVVGDFVGPDTHTCILQQQRNPFLTPEESNPVDRKMRERCFELTRERWPTNPPLTKYWTLTIYN
ncbi:retrovirus-related Pol polyprotein from transposon 412 [Trichonephila clavipes]|nr:retrovirus-related Pol polyprotein from transposon 412 [Trichonephila clavipes]